MYTKNRKDLLENLNIGVWAGGARGATAPPVAEIFRQNAGDSGKSTWEKTL